MNIISADKQVGFNFTKFSNADQKKSATDSHNNTVVNNEAAHGSKSSGVAKKILAGVLGVSMLTGAITATLPTNTAEANGNWHHGGGHHGGGHHGGGHHGGGDAAFGLGLFLRGLITPRHYDPYFPPYFPPPVYVPPYFPPHVYNRPPQIFVPEIFVPPQIFVPEPCW